MSFKTYTSVIALMALTACGGSVNDGAYESEQFSKSLPNPRAGNLTSLGNATLAGGDAVAAEKIYKQAIAEGGKGAEPYLALSNLYLSKNQPLKAIEVLKEGLDKDPQIPLTLANVLVSEGSPQEALKYAKMAAKADPENPRAFNTQGVALDNTGNYDEAQRSYRKALAVAEGDTNYINNNLGLSYIMSDDYSKAISLLEPIAESKEATPTIRQNLALAYGLKGEAASAKKWMLKDLPEDKANENLAFFKHYSKERILSSRNTVSDETVAADETAVESVQSHDLAMPKGLLDDGKPVAKAAAKPVQEIAQTVATSEAVQVSMVPQFKPERENQIAAAEKPSKTPAHADAVPVKEEHHAKDEKISEEKFAFAEPLFKPSRSPKIAKEDVHSEQQASISPHKKDQMKAQMKAEAPQEEAADHAPTPQFKPLADVEPSAGNAVKAPEAISWATIPRPHFKPRLD